MLEVLKRLKNWLIKSLGLENPNRIYTEELGELFLEGYKKGLEETAASEETIKKIVVDLQKEVN